MTEHNLPEFSTLIIGLVAIAGGDFICDKINVLKRLAIPPAVVGGLFIAVLKYGIENVFDIRIDFATQLRDLLILVFFVALGFTAKLGALRAGGKPLIIICLVTVVLLAIQNVIGIAAALAGDVHPFYGLLAGSVSFVGGPGTALAWAKEGTALGLEHTELVGLSAATFAVASGAIVSGPVVSWIIKRHNLKSESEVEASADYNEVAMENKVTGSQAKFITTLLLVLVAVWLGKLLHQFAATNNFMLPGFLCALMIGILITNLADLSNLKLPVMQIDRIGEIALQTFLAISMMSLKLNAIGVILIPLTGIVILQVVVSIAVAYFILFRALGKNFDAAVTVGGFLGYGISSMPVAMATMEQISRRFGPAPNAILLITLAGSFFVDFANAFIVKGFVSILHLF